MSRSDPGDASDAGDPGDAGHPGHPGDPGGPAGSGPTGESRGPPDPGRRLRPLLEAVPRADRADADAVRRRLDGLVKPPGSLGRLERLAVRLARAYGDPPPPLRRRTIFLLAADHGVARRGVSAYPSDVTARMCEVFAERRACVHALAAAVDAEVVAADFGVDADLGDLPGLIDARVRRGSRDLSEGPALTREEAVEAILRGAALVEGGGDGADEGDAGGAGEPADEGDAGNGDPTPGARDRGRLPDIVGLGEMGIGNTTAASALTAALTGAPVERVVGPGAGLDEAGIERKREVVRAAVARLGRRRGPGPRQAGTSRAAGAGPARDPAGIPALDALAELGGLEIAGLVGVVLGAARARRAVVTDGFIATAAALTAVRLAPRARGWLFASHLSAEPGHRVLLRALRLRPLLRLDMRLGEGTGAALAFPILDGAGGLLRDVATLEEIGLGG